MAKTRKGKKDNNNNNTGEIVLTAIKKLTRNTGWTVRTIVKFIKMEYKLNDDKLSLKVSRALKRGVRLGILQATSGRYRLNDMSRLVQVDSNIVRHHTQAASQRQRRTRPLVIHSRSPSEHSMDE